MLPIRLEIKNFLAYRSPDPVRFEGIHLACLTGANGAGKSSLLDAITWALWGKARTRSDNDLVHMGQSEMYVMLEFEQEGTVYRVIRRRSRKSNSGALNLLSLMEDGSWNNMDEPNMRATQAKINRLLRLDYETFVHSAFLQQGKADAFSTKQPTQRKQILTDILGLSRFETYEAHAKDTIKALSEQIGIYDSRIQEIDTELAREPQYQRELAEAQEVQQAAQAALNHALEMMREVEGATVDLRKAQERKAEIEQRLKEYEREAKTLEEDRQRREARIAEYELVVAARDEIEQGYQKLQNARQDDQALGGKLQQRADFDEQRREIERQIEAVRAELMSEAAEYDGQIGGLERQIAAAKHDELAEVRAELAAMAALNAQQQTVSEAVMALETERADLTATNRTLKSEMDALRDRLDRLEATEGALCPVCGQPLSEEKRLELIDQLHRDGTTRGDTYRANGARVMEIAALIAEHQATLKTLETDLRRRAKLEQQEGKLQAGVDAAHKASLELDEVRARLDAVRGILERDEYALELRAQLSDIDQQIAQVGYDKDRHADAKQQLNQYVAYEQQYTRLTTALDALPDMREALAGTLLRIERLESAWAALEQQYEETELEIARLTVLANEYKVRSEEVSRQRTIESQANIRLGAAQQNLAALESLRERKADLEIRLAEARENRAVYEELKLAFGKNGIPAMIIETAIPELESAANRLLTRMTDGRMNLQISTQRDKQTGGVAETLDIQIADELGTRQYQMFSGGEAFRIDFALRVALSQFLARRAGAHLRTLFIDEGFGTQDEDGRNKLIEAITAIQEDFDMILVITHIDDLRDSFPVHIAIDKTSEGSRISLR